MSQSKVYTTGSMLKASVLSVTSEATNYEIGFALDQNLRTYWKGTTTANQVITIDLNRETELISGIGNKDFSVANDWANSTMATFDATTDLTITSSGSAQVCWLVSAGLHDGFKVGRTYRITYDYTERAAGFTLDTYNSTTPIDAIGTAVAGTGQTITFTATAYADKLAISSSTALADGDFDNFRVTIMDDRQLIDGYAIWLNNIEEDLAPTSTPRILLEFSDDNTNWEQAYNNTHQGHVSTYRYGRMYIVSTGAITQEGHRYWRFTLSSNALVAEVAGFFLLKEHDLTAHPDEFPQKQPRSHNNRVTSSLLGDRFTNIGLTTPQHTFTRKYKIVTQSMYDELEDIFYQSVGGGAPVILQEGTEAYVCDIIDKKFDPKQIDVGFWEITMTFLTKPYTLPAEEL